MDLFSAAELAIMLASGVYYAYKRNFLVIFSKKYNVFPVRLIFTVPIFSGSCFVFSMLIYMLLQISIPSLTEAASRQFGPYIFLLVPIIVNAAIIFVFNKCIIEKTDSANEQESELYIYSPLLRHRSFGGKQHGTKFSNPTKKGNVLFGIQESELIVDEKELEDIDFAYAFNGEIVAGKKALQILNDSKLTGFETRPIKNIAGPINENYFQLTAAHTMPKVGDRTKIVSNTLFTFRSKIIVNNEMYYDKTVLAEALDFNQSLEAFGNEEDVYGFPPTKHWIVTKKTRSVLIEKLNQYEFDFIPILLTDEEYETN